MRRFFSIILLFVLMPLLASADSYSSLWKKYDAAQEDDKPKDCLAVLEKISVKAATEKEWGQMLKAELVKIDVQASVTPDSILPMLRRFEQGARSYQTSEPVMAAVYNTCLGTLYRDYRSQFDVSADSAKVISQRYYAKALADKGILAEAKARDYEPLLVNGADSRYFDYDLLHVIAFEAGEYKSVNEWYDAHDNRTAACLCAYYQLQEERREDVKESRKSKYMARLDSLIQRYQDLPVAGEVAIEHYNFMSQATDASAQEKVEYIDYALRMWPTWPRMAVLKNARQYITLPSFHAHVPETVVIPNKQIPVYVTSLVNIQNLHMTVTKVNMTGAEEFDPSNAKDLKMIRSLMEDQPVYEDSRVFYGLPEYKEVRDTMTIAPLPLGVYLVEFTTDNSQVPTERLLLHITNLRLLDMDLPGKQIRLIAVDATTGKSVDGAKILLKFREWKKGKREESEETLTTDSHGEVTFSSTLNPYEYRVMSRDDRAMGWQSISASWSTLNDKTDKVQYEVSAYTDRAIYRPGQKVEASVVAYRNGVYSGDNSPLDGKEVTMILYDANYKEVETQKLTTNEWGVASTEFAIPANVDRTGWFFIKSEVCGSTSRKAFRVEEYKRPTFTVSIDEYKDAYKAGDTISVVGHAQTYAGVPVQGATVKYTYSSGMASWWRSYSATNVSGTANVTQETTTQADGSFEMRIAIVKPTKENDRYRCFYAETISANVTSLAGETHSANTWLPLSDTPTALLIDGLPVKTCKEQLPEVTFRYLNNAGQPVDATVQYSIDGGPAVSAKANEKVAIDFASLSEGSHTMKVLCGTDSVSQNFVYFSLDDKMPVIQTDDWYYDNVGTYDNSFNFKEGQPVRMQIGTSRDDQTIYYSMVNATKVLEEGSFVLSNANMNRDLIYKEEWGDGIAVRYSWVRDGKMYTHSERLHKPEKDTNLTMEWSTFRDKLQPGQKEEWKLTIKNPDGTPANAHMIACLYDKSLDAIQQNNWNLSVPHYMFTPQIHSSVRNISSDTNVYGEQNYNPIAEPELNFYHFDDVISLWYIPQSFMHNHRLGGVVLKCKEVTLSAPSVKRDEEVLDLAETADVQPENETKMEAVRVRGTANVGVNDDDVPVRENMVETATFQPDLVTDKNGNVSIKFTLPESLTTWRFVGVAHDKEMKNGQITAEAIAQKQLMVQPNMPRFLREGDKAALVTTITNTTDKKQSGTATLTLISAETEKQVFQQKVPFTVAGNQTTSATFNIPDNITADMYVAKVTAKSSSFSDGEQQYLPVLSQKEVITTTRAITQVKPGKKVVNLDDLFGENTSNESVTIQYTNNPAWMMIDALPAAVKDSKDSKNAVTLSAALYAATLAEAIKKQVPDVQLDTDTLDCSISDLRAQLLNLQNADGSYSWWPQMPGSTYITSAVALNLIRLDHLLGVQEENSELITKAMNFLAGKIAKEVVYLKKEEQESKVKPMPSELAMNYLYLQAICQPTLLKSNKSDVEYLLSLIESRSKELTIYGKANTAVTFALTKYGNNKKKADDLIESALQYSVSTEEMGRYYDTPKAQYTWCDYKIPSQTATIEALQEVRPQDKQSVAEMRQWLLNEKRTQEWDTPINTTSAIYAFLNGNMSSLDDISTPVTITLDKTTFTTSGEKKGYFETTQQGRYKTLTFDKTSENMSWGAVSTEAMQPLSDVKDVDENQLKVTRELLTEDGKPATDLKVGQKVVVRITITAGRDYDFVEVVDNRAACMEPVSQVSGYRWGYYLANGDKKTSYYFNQLGKGQHVVETTYYIDRAGTYQSGIVTAKCAYAPEFSAREKAITLNIK